MIVSLRGTVIDITAHHAVIECAGVGYQVLATPTTLGHLTRGAETFILITMIVREESQTLYGFLDAATRDMFATLQTVSGLGPKLALAAQSVYTTPELAHAITHGDTKTLQKIPGVGKRMAERMVVDLKDKVATYAAPETPTPPPSRTPTPTNKCSKPSPASDSPKKPPNPFSLPFLPPTPPSPPRPPYAPA